MDPQNILYKKNIKKTIFVRFYTEPNSVPKQDIFFILTISSHSFTISSQNFFFLTDNLTCAGMHTTFCQCADSGTTFRHVRIRPDFLSCAS